MDAKYEIIKSFKRLTLDEFNVLHDYDRPSAKYVLADGHVVILDVGVNEKNERTLEFFEFSPHTKTTYTETSNGIESSLEPSAWEFDDEESCNPFEMIEGSFTALYMALESCGGIAITEGEMLFNHGASIFHVNENQAREFLLDDTAKIHTDLSFLEDMTL